MSRTVMLIGGAVAAILVAAAVIAGIRANRGDSADTDDTPAGVERVMVASRNHVQGTVAYAQTPPAGGDHAPVWQNCGFYDAAVPSETAVHSMEHGAVWLAYRPDLPAAQVEALRNVARGQTFVLVSPFPDLPAPVVASAWGRQMRAEPADDPRVGEFVKAFRVGPQTPEPGAPCISGVGVPK